MLLLLHTLFSVLLLPFAWRVARNLREWARVPEAAPPATTPRVCILVPARDEERSIERCVRSLLNQRYPREQVQVVVIDDRSTDATPAILARLAAEDDRLRVLQGTPLPQGWKGKCWALQQASQQADPRADYLLFVDADTVHQPCMLASTVRYAEEHGVDLLSLAPGMELGSEAERLTLPTILGLTLSFKDAFSAVNDPAQPDVARAIGQFILFRAEAYRELGGHEAVRDEIVEDFELARIAKRRGLRILLADGRHLVQTRMYQSAGEIWQGFSKNAYDEAQTTPGGAFIGLLGLPLLVVGPYLVPLVALRRYLRRGRLADWLVWVQGVAQVAVLWQISRTFVTSVNLPARYALAQPLSIAFLWGILANSTWRNLSGRGVTWKGRRY